MKFASKLSAYLNPVARLGNTHYSYLFPLIGTISTAIALEIYFFIIVKNHAAVGLYAIGFFIALIIYFSFRDGILGGIIATIVTICYYIYLIFSLHYKGAQFASGIDTTIILGLIYLFIATVIGWLKQTIDKSIEREADGRIRLQSIIQQLPVGILIADSDGRITQSNSQANTILDFKTPIGLHVGAKNLVPSLYKGKPFRAINTPLLQSLQTGKGIYGREYQLFRRDGKKVDIRINTAPIHNKANKIIAAALIMNDVTTQKEIEQRKDDFVNMASHELKTPITSIKLFLEVLTREVEQYNNARANHVLTNIKDQTSRLQNLVNDLLDVSRLQTGKMSIKKESFRLDIFIENTLKQMDETTAQKIILLKTRKLKVSADKLRIYQVLTNLLSNAVKYSSEQGDIIVKLEKKEDKALISIQDFGIGIPQDQQKKIFDRLYQVADDKSNTFPGFGMGLYIVKEIIKRHKGTIWVESTVGKGSTFFFTLPLVT